MIDTLIFDFDGVIIDTETPDFATWQETFQGFGVVLDRSWWTQFIGGSSRRMEICALLEDLLGHAVDCPRLTGQRRQRYLEVAIWKWSSPTRCCRACWNTFRRRKDWG